MRKWGFGFLIRDRDAKSTSNALAASTPTSSGELRFVALANKQIAVDGSGHG